MLALASRFTEDGILLEPPLLATPPSSSIQTKSEQTEIQQPKPEKKNICASIFGLDDDDEEENGYKSSSDITDSGGIAAAAAMSNGPYRTFIDSQDYGTVTSPVSLSPEVEMSFFLPRIVYPIGVSIKAYKADDQVIKLLNSAPAESAAMFSFTASMARSSKTTITQYTSHPSMTSNGGGGENAVASDSSMLVRVRLVCVTTAPSIEARGVTAIFYDLDRACFYKVADVYLLSHGQAVMYAMRISRQPNDTAIEPITAHVVYEKINAFLSSQPNPTHAHARPTEQMIEELMMAIVPKTHSFEVAFAGPARKNARTHSMYVLPSSLMPDDDSEYGSIGPESVARYLWQDFIMRRLGDNEGPAGYARRLCKRIRAFKNNHSTSRRAVATYLGPTGPHRNDPRYLTENQLFEGLLLSSNRYLVSRYVEPSYVSSMTESQVDELTKRLSNNPVDLFMNPPKYAKIWPEDIIQAIADASFSDKRLLAPSRMLTNDECSERFRLGNALGSEYGDVSTSQARRLVLSQKRWHIESSAGIMAFADVAATAAAAAENNIKTKKARRGAPSQSDIAAAIEAADAHTRTCSNRALLSASDNPPRLLAEMLQLYNQIKQKYLLEGACWQSYREDDEAIDMLVQNNYLVSRKVAEPSSLPPAPASAVKNKITREIVWLEEPDTPVAPLLSVPAAAPSFEVCPASVCEEIEDRLETLLLRGIQAWYHSSNYGSRFLPLQAFKDRLRYITERRNCSTMMSPMAKARLNRILTRCGYDEWDGPQEMSGFETSFLEYCCLDFSGDSRNLVRLLSASDKLFVNSICVITNCTDAEVALLEDFAKHSVHAKDFHVMLLKDCHDKGPQWLLERLSKLYFEATEGGYSGAIRMLVPLLENTQQLSMTNTLKPGKRFFGKSSVVVTADSAQGLTSARVIDGAYTPICDTVTRTELLPLVIEYLKL